ncbi:hypothetical protein [Stenoxybacter acetivorans]|nr:hypothetical protein [Stenoxybacter acetivorans]
MRRSLFAVCPGNTALLLVRIAMRINKIAVLIIQLNGSDAAVLNGG